MSADPLPGPGIEIRVAESDADLEAWRQVRLTVLPDERCLDVEEMRAMMTPETVYLIAHLDGELAGSGLRGSFQLRLCRTPSTGHAGRAAARRRDRAPARP